MHDVFFLCLSFALLRFDLKKRSQAARSTSDQTNQLFGSNWSINYRPNDHHTSTPVSFFLDALWHVLFENIDSKHTHLKSKRVLTCTKKLNKIVSQESDGRLIDRYDWLTNKVDYLLKTWMGVRSLGNAHNYWKQNRANINNRNKSRLILLKHFVALA